MASKDMRGGNYAAELQPKEIYRDRRRRLFERVGEGTVVMWGAGDDRGYGDVGTFRQGSNFFYLTGVELPNAVVVLRPGEGGDLLFLPPRNPNVERWTGPKWGPGEEAAEMFGFDEVMSTEPSEIVLDARRRPVPGFEGRLQGWLSEPGAVLWTELPAVGSGAVLPPTHRYLASLRERLPTFSVRDLDEHMTALRSIKEAGEIEIMRKAIEITIEGHRRAARTIVPGIGESVIDGVVYAAFREGVVDIGARYGYYCGDLTRTYPANGRFTDRQREIYDLVLEAHDRAAEATKPGVTVFDLRKIVYGVFEGSKVRDSKGESLGQYFIHGLGHPLGLDAHDPGADENPLEPGMVITNEPGIYLPDEELGVRIENDFLITEDGAENLSADLPVTADDIEALMRS
jgi:Xaa-Pro aminopeptidase